MIIFLILKKYMFCPLSCGKRKASLQLSPVFHVREEVAEVLEAHGVGLTLLSLFRQADVTDIELQRCAKKYASPLSCLCTTVWTFCLFVVCVLFLCWVFGLQNPSQNGAKNSSQSLKIQKCLAGVQG